MNRLSRRSIMALPLVPLTARFMRAFATTVSYSSTNYSAGDHVIAKVVTDETGDLSFESDFLQASSSVMQDASGITNVDLGPVNKAGSYRAVIMVGSFQYAADLFFTPNDTGDGFVMLEGNMSSVASPSASVDQAALDTFWANFTVDRLKVAFDAVIEPWIGVNAVGVGSTVVVCMVPALAAACGWSILNKVIDLSVVTLRAMIDQEVSDHVLTPAQAAKASYSLGVVDGANKMADIALGADNLDKVLKAIGALTDLAVDSNTNPIRLTVSYGKDGYGKYIVLLKVLQKL